jgi:hypothetical protein
MSLPLPPMHFLVLLSYLIPFPDLTLSPSYFVNENRKVTRHTNTLG